MSLLDWIAVGLFVLVGIDLLFIAWVVRLADARERAEERARQITPFPYREALGYDSEAARHDHTRGAA